MTAQARGWGPPPVSRSKVDPGKAPLSGATFPGGVHQDLVALAETLLEITERRGYHCVPGWCWGLAARKVRGSSTTWSNHAWALALDINAPTNPMTSRLITDMPSWMPRLWEAHGFRWGGRYKTRPDAMHYEYMGRPRDVAKHLASARQQLAALGGPTEDEEDDVMKRGDKGAEVTVLQWRINQYLHGENDPRKAGKAYGLKVDGDYGPATEDYVRHVQSTFGYDPSGVYNLPTALRLQERLIQLGVIRVQEPNGAALSERGSD